MAVIDKPPEEPPQRHQRPVDGGDSLPLFPPQAIFEIGNVPGRHPLDGERLGIGLGKPRCKFSQILHHSTARIGCEVLVAKIALDQDGLVRPDRDGVKNIITRILHGLSPRIGHKLDTETL